MTPDQFKQQFQSAVNLHQQGQAQAAKDIYLELLSDSPNHPELHHLLGLTKAMLGDLAAGIADILAAIQLKPDAPAYHNNLGQLLLKSGRLNEALPYLQRAVQIDPTYLEAANNLAQGLIQTGQYAAARQVYKQALNFTHSPSQQAQRTQIHYNLATLCAQMGDYPALLAYTAQILTDDPTSLPALQLQLDAQLKIPDLFAAIATAQAIWKQEPVPENGLRLLSLLPPPLFKSQEDLNHWRNCFESLLTELSSQPLTLTGGALRIDNTPFYLSYMGFNDKNSLMQLAGLYRQILPEHPPQGPVKSKMAPKQKRIGFCSLHFFDHSVSHCFGKLIEAFTEVADFEILLYSMEKAQQDSQTELLRSVASQFVVLPDDLDASAERIAADQLDMLIYPDIGIDTFTWMLAFTRLAPVQMALSGHPVTTGIPTIDYYISSELLEGPEAQIHYSEKLVLLKSIAVNYALPPLPKTFKSREQIFTELNLSHNKHLYLCPMMPFKFHPDLDPLLRAILETDPEAEIAIFDYPLAFFSDNLLPRLEQNLSPYAQRLRVLPWLPQATFLNLLAHVDVALDTPHFGAGNTAYLSLGLGTPMVTLPSPFLRGRSTQALYQQMDLPNLIAHTPEEYVQLALRLGSDRAFQTQMRENILAKNHLLFDRKDGIDELIDFVKNRA
jgi:protein O-GlcNAc transferase